MTDATHTSSGRRAAAAYAELDRRLRTGEWGAGAPLPPERRLAMECGVSRSTLRTVLARLGREGRVAIRHGSGIYAAAAPAAARSRTVAVMYQYDGASLAQVQHEVLRRGCLPSVFSQVRAAWSPEAERRYLEQVLEQRCRTLLAFCSPRPPGNDDLLRALEEGGTRVVHIEHYRVEPPAQAYLLPDYRRAGHLAAVSFLLAGCRTVWLAGQRGSHAPFAELIRQGFREALEDHGNGAVARAGFFHVPPAGPVYQRRLAEQARSVPAGTGILCLTLGYAETLVAALRAAGRRVPEDVGVVGVQLLDDADHGTADHLSFRRPQLLHRAIAAALAPHWRPPRELVRPVWVRHGSSLPRTEPRKAP